MSFENWLNITSNNDLGEIFKEIISRHTAIIEDLNRAQLRYGADALGNNLKEYASESYAKYKREIGAVSLPFADLKLTGDFYDSFLTKINENYLELDAKDYKTKHLKQKYGEILGLSPDNLEVYVKEYFYPELMKILLNETF